jgi:hypothetical protein
MSLLINKRFAGFPHHALLDEGKLRWSSEIVEADYHYGFDNSDRALEPLLDLFGEKRHELVPPEVINSFKECGYSSAPWHNVMPPKRFKALSLEFIKNIKSSLGVVQSSEYSAFFIETNELFSYLSQSTISKEECRKYLTENDNHSLKTILAMSAGAELPKPMYNRVSTKTGRLTIKAGPQILTLKKEYRSIFKPSRESNKLYEIDFNSLEPRVALNIAGKKASSDVYSSFAQDLGLNISRDVAKLAVLCALYGAGISKLESVLRSSDHKITASELLRKVKQHFQISTLSKSLRSQATNGEITNCFGRPITVDDARDAILVNNFLQSSATDIALLGFLDFCRKLKDIIRPIFIIHDALIFEANPEQLGPIAEYVDNGFELKEMGNFPLKITEFSSNE